MVDFNQALDARLVTKEFAKQLAQINWLDHNCIRFGCDTKQQIDDCEKAMDMIVANGFKGHFFLYTMLNDNFQECYDRLNYWWQVQHKHRLEHLPDVFPYAQPYRDPDNPKRPIPQWQKDMAQWVNKHQIFQITAFDDFEPRKGFKCSEYAKKL